MTKALFAIAALFGCAYTLSIVDMAPALHGVCGYRSSGVLIAQSRDANERRECERREDEVREHEADRVRQRDRELKERAADTAKESHDFKMHDFLH